MNANELCLTEIQSSCVLPSFNCVPQAQDEASVSSQDSGIGSATSLIEEDPSSVLNEALNSSADLSDQNVLMEHDAAEDLSAKNQLRLSD